MEGLPLYSRAEQIADGCIHAVGVSAGLVGAAVLLVLATQQDDALLTLAVLLYGFGLIIMLSASALYNVSKPSPRRLVFRRFDHAAIFVMIAGSYTPFALISLGGASGRILMTFVWAAALTGAALKLWAPHLLRSGVSTALYLMLGWSGIVAIEPLFAVLSTSSLMLLAAGGALYSLGAAFHHWRRLPFHNAIWHGCVLAAAACHYGAILSGVVLTGATA